MAATDRTAGGGAGIESSSVVSAFPAQAAKTIGTHSGSFHCDEALACAMLKTLPEWQSAVIVRSRDPKVLDQCDAVVDVGGVYDAAKLRLDHHQKSFTDTMTELNSTTRLSSAGLVYRHFGRDFIKQIAAGRIPDAVIEKVLYNKVYKNFMEHIDGIDNGVNAFDGQPRYAVTTTLSSRVGSLNPSWNEDSSDAVVNAQFVKAMALTLSEMSAYITSLCTSWWPARSIVEASLRKAVDVHPSGAVLVLDGFCPWKDHLMDLETEQGLGPRTKFVLYAEVSWD